MQRALSKHFLRSEVFQRNEPNYFQGEFATEENVL